MLVVIQVNKTQDIEQGADQHRAYMPGFRQSSGKENEKDAWHKGAFLQELIPYPDPEWHAGIGLELSGCTHYESINERWNIDGNQHQDDCHGSEEPVVFKYPEQDHRSKPISLR